VLNILFCRYEWGNDDGPMRREIFYRSVQILMNMFNNCYQNLAFCWTQIATGIGMIISVYGTIRFYGKFNLLAYLSLPTSWIFGFLYIYVVYPKAAETSTALRKTSDSWKNFSLETIPCSKSFVTLINNGMQTRSHIPQIYYIRCFEKKNDNFNEPQSNGVEDSHKAHKLNEAFIRSCPLVGVKASALYVLGRGSTFAFCHFIIIETITLLMLY